ncbi:MAG: M23 family metallopeptidase [Rhodanobacter sp.]
MKLLLGFVAGVACGAALMFQLMHSGWLVPDRVSSLPAATSLNPLPAAPMAATTPTAPLTSAPTALAVAAPTAAVDVELSAGRTSAVSVTLPAAVATSHANVAGSGFAVGVPADVPTAAVSGLLIPVQGILPADLRDTFTQARSSDRVHDAIDIMAPRGTPVLAANDGHVVKLFTSKPGGLTVYQFDPSEHVIYYYAHLDSYAPGLAEGQALHRGDRIGNVGSTGNASAEAPHLHFEVQLLGPEKQWWHATSINPYGRFAGQP